MRREDISDALGMLDDEILKHVDEVRRHSEKWESAEVSQAEICNIRQQGLRSNKAHQTMVQRSKLKERFRWKRRYVMVAGFCLICLTALAFTPILWEKVNSSFGASVSGELLAQKDFSGLKSFEEAGGMQGLMKSPEGADSPALNEPFVPVSDLFASVSDNPAHIKELAAAYAKIPVGEYTGFYERDYGAYSDILADSIGREVDNAKDWYYISGHTDLQYLIYKEEQSYTLWKFAYFDSDEYPYSDVLKLIYGIESADGIERIDVYPPKMDNSDAGKRIQEEIGTYAITNRDDIEAVYQMLCTMTCYGNNRWDLIDYGDAEAGTGGEGNHNAVRLGRYLTFVTDYGNEIDGLKYTAVSGMFYEFSGVAYNRLTKEQAEKVNIIFGIVKTAELESYDVHRKNSSEEVTNIPPLPKMQQNTTPSSPSMLSP